MAGEPKGKSALILVLCLLAIAVIATRFELSTDLSVFLPEPDSKLETLLHHQLDNGASSSMIFVALHGSDPKSLADASNKLLGKLDQSGLFQKVSNNAGSFGEDQLEVIEDNRYRLSRSDLNESFSVEGLQNAVQERLRGLTSPQARLEKKYLQADPTGEVISLLTEWQGKLSKHKTPEQRHSVWFSGDHSRALLLAEIEADISELDNQVAAVESIRKSFSELEGQNLQMIMTGPAAFAVESGEDIKADVRILTYMAVGMVVVFLWAAFGALRVVALVVAPLAVGVLIATAVILILYGQIHGITLAFGVTLAGVAVDYPIHLMTGLGSDRDRNVAHIRNIWPTLRLGVFSTIIAYAAFLFSGFGGLIQLGIFTITGLLAAALFSRYILPYLAARREASLHGLGRVHGAFKWGAQALSRFGWVVPTALALGVIVLATTTLPVLHLNVDSLSPIKETRRAEGRMLRGDLGFWAGGKMLVVVGENKEAVLQQQENIETDLDQLVSSGVISGFDMASQFLPSQKTQEQNLTVFRKSAEIRQNLEAALEGTPFKKAVFNPFLAQLPELATLQPLGSDELAETSMGDRLSPLLFDISDEAGGVILLHDVADEGVMAKYSESNQNLYYLNLKAEATNLVARNVKWVSIVMLGCVVIIYLMLSRAFQSWRRPLRVMVPTFSAAVVVATILVLVGCPLSIFHLISLLLVVGLGLDYALFFDRLPDNPEEWDTTFKSLWICGGTTVLVFGILTFSQTPPLKAIGVTVGIGATISMLFAAIWSTRERAGSTE
ncbi:MAG: MMPL family transporter [Pseudomonadota bacterium]